MTESVMHSGSDSEASATIAGARNALPIIHELEQLAAHWQSEGDAPAARTCQYAAVLFASVYRIAEDMGYEW